MNVVDKNSTRHSSRNSTRHNGIRHSSTATMLAIVLSASIGCSRQHAVDAAQMTPPAAGPALAAVAVTQFLGFDRNAYPGDSTMAAMRANFAFTGYWLTNPPGAHTNGWHGKRAVLRAQGWGFLVLANGRLDAEILRSQKQRIPPAALARQDALAAVTAARSEGFPAATILFLDQEEGGRLLDEQSAYLLAWTETVAANGFLPGAYASGQPVPDGPGATITTIDDIRTQVHAKHLHDIAMFAAQDACPPAPGCSLAAKPLDASGESHLIAWQYSQSPRRLEITKSCAATYAADGNCYAPGFPTIFLDMDAASSADPSRGR